jgi:hypothetical protein
MKIRIQDYDLTFDDIMRYPAWEYALNEESVEGQDERTVRPYLAPPPLNPNDSYFIVRASFFLADGTKMKGLIKPKQLGQKENISTVIPYDLGPIIISKEWKMDFRYGTIKPDPDDIAENYRIIGKRPNEIFPIQFRSDIEVSNSIIEGVIEGFMYFDESHTDFFRLQSSDLRYMR